jgi:hypothetical protein
MRSFQCAEAIAMPGHEDVQDSMYHAFDWDEESICCTLGQRTTPVHCIGGYVHA